MPESVPSADNSERLPQLPIKIGASVMLHVLLENQAGRLTDETNPDDLADVVQTAINHTELSRDEVEAWLPQIQGLVGDLHRD